MPDLTWLDWAVLAGAVVAIGFAKTAVSGTGSLAVAGFALVLPARESTGTILPLLILGDLFAIGFYRRHTDWRLIRRLVPWVGTGGPPRWPASRPRSSPWWPTPPARS